MKHLRQYIRHIIIEHNKKKEQEERKRRNQNRRDFEKAGLVKAGDGKEIEAQICDTAECKICNACDPVRPHQH